MRFARMLLFLLAALPATANTLYWKSIDVTARLEADGTLRVRERQVFVFDGTWNGGERRFRIGAGQELRSLAISRIADNGEAVPLRPGDLSKVDDYSFDGQLLRWRSRLPSDPPFENRELTYEIDYALSGILLAIPRDGSHVYRLNHDFAFADRPGEIRRFLLDLSLDPSWSVIGPPLRFSTVPIPPGKTFVVERELRHTGPPPATVRKATSPLVRNFSMLLLLAGFPLLFADFYRRERRRGRFRDEGISVDEAWLEENVFSELPEVVGYMYDGKSGTAAVGAVLARMVASGKLTSRVEQRLLRRPVLYLTRTRSIEDYDLAEQQIVHMFFVDGSLETDTLKIRKSYAKRGFDPGKRLEPTLRLCAKRHRNWSEVSGPDAKGRSREHRILALAFVLLASCAFTFFGLAFAIYMAVLGGGATAAGNAIATRAANRLRALPLWWFLATVVFAPALLLFILTATRGEATLSAWCFIAGPLYLLASYWFVLRRARMTEGKERHALRLRLAAARAWFVRQLRQKSPQLRDHWTPYLVALGLAAHVDRWFRAFGGSAGTTATSTSAITESTSSFGGGSVSSVGWSGGGGGFGGAGATGGWALAASTIAATSVSEPSSSNASSGGGSGGSGGSSSSSGDSSSSGGGGGGGW